MLLCVLMLLFWGRGRVGGARDSVGGVIEDVLLAMCLLPAALCVCY